jgi:hypothetical protein
MKNTKQLKRNQSLHHYSIVRNKKKKKILKFIPNPVLYIHIFSYNFKFSFGFLVLL